MLSHRWIARCFLVAVLAFPLAGADVASAALGALGEDLVYTPVTPCRLIDTRLSGGAIVAGEQRDYNLIGRTSFSFYGGANSDCGLGGLGAIFAIPQLAYNIPRALMLNVVAVTPFGQGNLRAWPTGETMPNASIINYGSSAGINIANGVVAKTCAVPCVDTMPPFTCAADQVCVDGDLSVLASFAPTHMVVDVMGYFRPAETTSVKVLRSEGVGGSVTLDGTCQVVAQCEITAPPNENGRVLVTASASIDFFNDNSTAQQAVVTVSDNEDCGTATDPGTVSAYLWPAVPLARYPAAVTRSFNLDAGDTGTYTLAARSYQGFGPLDDEVLGGIIECLFVP